MKLSYIGSFSGNKFKYSSFCHNATMISLLPAIMFKDCVGKYQLDKKRYNYILYNYNI